MGKQEKRSEEGGGTRYLFMPEEKRQANVMLLRRRSLAHCLIVATRRPALPSLLVPILTSQRSPLFVQKVALIQERIWRSLLGRMMPTLNSIYTVISPYVLIGLT